MFSILGYAVSHPVAVLCQWHHQKLLVNWVCLYVPREFKNNAKSSPVSTGCMTWITYDLVNQQGNRKIVRILVVLLGGEVCHCCQDLGCRTGLFLLIPVIGCICNFKRKRISLQNPPTTTVCRIEFLEKMHQQALRQLRTSREELKNDNLRASTRPFLKAKTMGSSVF